MNSIISIITVLLHSNLVV